VNKDEMAIGLLILVLVFYYALAKWGHKLPDIFGGDKDEHN